MLLYTYLIKYCLDLPSLGGRGNDFKFIWEAFQKGRYAKEEKRRKVIQNVLIKKRSQLKFLIPPSLGEAGRGNDFKSIWEAFQKGGKKKREKEKGTTK